MCELELVQAQPNLLHPADRALAAGPIDECGPATARFRFAVAALKEVPSQIATRHFEQFVLR
jgi:hypothetical protein